MSKTNGEGGEKKIQKTLAKEKGKEQLQTHPRFNY
jgi:hypothetical protein